MTPSPIFTGRILRGKLLLDEPQKYLVFMAGFEGKPVELVLRRKRSQRSLQQNRYYWGVVIEILGNHFGYEKEEMHEALKFKFLRTHDDTMDLPTVRSTTRLSTKEFMEYVERIQRWAAADHAVYIPDPNEAQAAGEIG